jgi:hypothetical protein
MAGSFILDDARAIANDHDGFAYKATLEGIPLGVIFDRLYLEPLGLAEGSELVAQCCLDDAPNAAQGQTLVIDGVGTFTVRGVEPDEAGHWLLLRLSI